jgi:hypothetical protein
LIVHPQHKDIATSAASKLHKSLHPSLPYGWTIGQHKYNICQSSESIINLQESIMTPDSKKTITAKIPAKKTVAGKTAVSTKKATAKKAVKKTALNPKETPAKKVAKKPTSTSKPRTQSISITSEERWKMIAIAAYHKAENRGFAPGGELQDWAEAEQEIDELLNSG